MPIRPFRSTPFPRAAACLLLVAALSVAAADAPPSTSPAPGVEVVRRSVVSPGDPARLQRILAKARDGEAVTVAVIGGSITEGAKATKPQNRYGNLVADWWQRKFPAAKVRFVNAGIGATGTSFGSLRAGRDLLSKQPDFVVVEYSVNDRNVQPSAETMEGLVRQILAQPNRPAVMLLFMVNKSLTNAQEWHGKVGAHYALPMVSFRDALAPEIEAGRLKWEELEADQVHPNDRGHAWAATLVTAALERVLADLPATSALPEVKPLPQPLFGDLFEHTALFDGEAMKPVSNQGWTYDAKLKAWKSDAPGSVIEFELSGRVLFTMHYVIKGPMGRARVSVDGKPAKDLEAWFDQTWGGYRQTNEVARLSDAGPHRVRIELLGEKSAGSEGHEFRLLGLGAAGVAGQ